MQELLDKSNALLKKPVKARRWYYKRLEEVVATRQITVVQGQRRVGKSHIIIGYIQRLAIDQSKVFFFNKELDHRNIIQTHDDLANLYELHVQQNGQPSYLIVDEVQDIQERERFVRGKQAEGKQHIILTGSNSQLLSSELSTYLTGRYMPLEVLPLDYMEYLQFTEQEHSPQQFLQYTRWGGLPEVALIETELEKENYLQTVLNTILYKDIVSRFTLKEPLYLKKILSFFADTIGSPTSLRNVRNSSNNYGREIKSLTTLSTYISYLMLPYLMHSASRFDIHGKKMLEHNEKYYFNDIGIRNTLRVKMEIDIGKIIENIVYLHLRKLGYTVYVGNMGNKEIDFVAKKGDKLCYVQVAYLIADEQTRKREFGNLLSIRDAHPKFVVSTDPLAKGGQDGVQWLNIYEFLKSDPL